MVFMGVHTILIWTDEQKKERQKRKDRGGGAVGGSSERTSQHHTLYCLDTRTLGHRTPVPWRPHVRSRDTWTRGTIAKTTTSTRRRLAPPPLPSPPPPHLVRGVHRALQLELGDGVCELPRHRPACPRCSAGELGTPRHAATAEEGVMRGGRTSGLIG